MKKKGFTLVEVLVVVGILGILVIIAVPNVVNSFNKSKETNFISEAQAVFKQANNAYVLDKAKGYSNFVYTNNPSYSGRLLDVSSRQGFVYLVVINTEGEVVQFYVHDDEREIDLDSSLTVIKLKDITKSKLIGSSGSNGGEVTSPGDNPASSTTPSTTCSRNQYVLNGECKACPRLCTCDGLNATCSGTGGGTTTPIDIDNPVNPSDSLKTRCQAQGKCFNEQTGMCRACDTTQPINPTEGY